MDKVINTSEKFPYVAQPIRVRRHWCTGAPAVGRRWIYWRAWQELCNVEIGDKAGQGKALKAANVSRFYRYVARPLYRYGDQALQTVYGRRKRSSSVGMHFNYGWLFP